MDYEISLITAVGISVLFALSLNLITGFCGQISLGQHHVLRHRRLHLGAAMQGRPAVLRVR